MKNRLNPYNRKKLLEALDEGRTDNQIKKIFGIKDQRTLQSHIELARQEQAADFIKKEIRKEVLKDHLDEVRTLMEDWKEEIRIQPVTISPSDMVNPVESHHRDRTFNSLKSHLPFPTLWRDYKHWLDKHGSYIDNCENLRWEIEMKVTEKPGLDFMDDSAKESHLCSQLIDWILCQVEYKLRKGSERGFKFRWTNDRVETDNQLTQVEQMQAFPEGQILLIIYEPVEKDKAGDRRSRDKYYEDKCGDLLRSCLDGESVKNLLELFGDLRHLESKINDSLEDILQRRDYVFYDCKLCPGNIR